MGRTAVVVGGGIGGLAAAIGLRRVGWAVTIMERAPNLGDVGAGITLLPNGVRCLDALGVGTAVREASNHQRVGGTRRPDGRWLGRLHGADLERMLGTPSLCLPRSELHCLLRAALPPETLRLGTTVTSLDQRSHPGRVRVGYELSPDADEPHASEGEGELEVDLVVAADGINSHLRAQLLPDQPRPRYCGSSVLRGVTDGPFEIGADFTVSMGQGLEFGQTAFADGRAGWFVALKAPEGRRFADPLAEMRRMFRDWHDPIPELLARTRPGAVSHHDIYELHPRLPSYVAGRVVLLGDAAHAMTPFLGQGASQALEDAVVLAASFARESTVEKAAARYDSERRPRSQSVARASRHLGRLGRQLSNPLATRLRDAALRATPMRVSYRAVRWQTDWTPPTLP